MCLATSDTGMEEVKIRQLQTHDLYLYRSGHHQFPSTKILINGGEGRGCVAIRGGRGRIVRNEVELLLGLFYL